MYIKYKYTVHDLKHLRRPRNILQHRQNVARASGTSRQLTCVRSASMMRDEAKDFVADTQMESTDLRAEMMATSGCWRCRRWDAKSSRDLRKSGAMLKAISGEW